MDSIDVMKYDRSIFLCVFQEGYLRELIRNNGYNPGAMRTIINYIEQFIRVSYCPTKYIDMVMDQLTELHDMDDTFNDERNKIIEEAIVKKYTLKIKDEYYREQLMYYIGQLFVSINNDPRFNIDYKNKSYQLCTAYIKRISTISKDEDPNKVMKKNYVNGLFYDLFALCGEDYALVEIIANYIEKVQHQIESVEDIDGFTHYNSYLKMRDIDGKINEENFDSAIEVLLRDTNVELDILSTHLDPNYIINERDNMIEFCDKEGYYRCINSLIRNNKKLLENKQFIKTIRTVVQLANSNEVDNWLGDNKEIIKGR